VGDRMGPDVDDPGYSGPLVQGPHNPSRYPRGGRGEDAVGDYLGRIEADLFPACTHAGSFVRPRQ